MRNHVSRAKPVLYSALLLALASAGHAQNPQVRPPQPGTATGISGDSAASMPLLGRREAIDRRAVPAAGGDSGASLPDKGSRGKFKDKPYKPGGTKSTLPDSGAEPSDPHQVNGRATGGPDNKASEPEPSTGRGTGLVR